MRRSRVGLPGHTGLPSPGTHLSGKPTNRDLTGFSWVGIISVRETA